MTKYFITAVTLFFLIPALKAQDITYGIKAGGNMFNLKGNFLDEANERYSFHAGLIAEIDFNEKLRFQAELLYSEQGNDKKWSIEEYNNPESDYDYRFTRKYNYLTFPVLAKLKIIKVFG